MNEKALFLMLAMYNGKVDSLIGIGICLIWSQSVKYCCSYSWVLLPEDKLSITAHTMVGMSSQVSRVEKHDWLEATLCVPFSLSLLAGRCYCSARMPVLDGKFSCKELTLDIWDLGGPVLFLCWVSWQLVNNSGHFGIMFIHWHCIFTSLPLRVNIAINNDGLQFQYLRIEMSFYDNSEWIFLGEMFFCGKKYKIIKYGST